MDVHNLPHHATPFVGRFAEIAEITHKLSDPNCHLLTLVGPGGIGKTRLAVEVALRYIEQVAVRICFVPLQPLNSSDFMVAAIADAAHFQFSPGTDPRLQILDFLREKSLLLVLDNLEHLTDGTELLSEIVSVAPGVCILATSRERLNLLEEWVFDVRELNYPSNESETDIEPYDAVQMFMQHARRVQTGLHLTALEKPAVSRICRLVGGMPLGIELAAAWVRALSVEEIAQEIEHGLDILETPARNIEPRHRSIRAAFEPMWNRLSNEQRDVFKKLSVFRGGFTREAAEYVAGASLNALFELVDRSLIRTDSHGRYDLHELLRQYAEEQLRAQAGEMQIAYEQHCQYYARFLAEKEIKLEGREQKEGFTQIQREIDNVRAAWRWAVDHKRGAEIETASHALWYFYDTRSLYLEGELAFRSAAEALGLHDPGANKSTTLGRLMACYGGFCFSLNRGSMARSLLEESLTILRRNDAQQEIGFALLRLSEVALFLEDDTAAAQEYLQESLAIFRAAGSDWGIAYSLRWLAFVALYKGDYRHAQALSRDSLTVYEQTGEPLGKALALNIASFSAFELGDYVAAKRVSQEISALSHAIGLRWNLYSARIMYGVALCGLGDYEEARQHLRAGLIDACDIRFAPFVLHCLLDITFWLIATGSPIKALQILSFLQDYPVPPIKGKLPAGRRLDELRKVVNAEMYAETMEEGRTLDLETAVQICMEALLPRAETPPILNEREREIVELVASGFSNRQIADHLVFSVGTVKWYLHQIYSKLGVGSRTQAVARARELSLLP